MNTLEDLVDYDDEFIIDVINEPLTEIVRNMRETKTPKTLEAILMLQMSGNFIKTGIHKLAQDDNDYAKKILLRSLYEHFIRSMYIFISYSKTKTDSAGIEFYKWINTKENIDFLNSIKSRNHLDNNKQFDEKILEEISNIYAGFSDLSKNDVNASIKKIGFNQMLKFVYDSLENIRPIIVDFPEEYSSLSSFVHGGPFSNMIQLTLSISSEKRTFEYLEESKTACILTGLMLNNLFIVASNSNNSYLEYLPKISEYIKQVL